MFHVYILRSLRDGSHYIGQTSDLARRVEQHNIGACGFTSRHFPYELIHYETYETRGEATTRERFLKTREGHLELKEKGIL
ncbi:MAG: GIY-YIG nuclease family protein [Chlorobiota bacterium]|nr:MAG: GIY-YIG nuclease family protein [Chlorobiota bacterium]